MDAREHEEDNPHGMDAARMDHAHGMDASGMDASERARALARLLERYRALASARVKDHFVEQAWETLVPPSWKPHLDELSLDALASMLASPVPPPARGVWPLSLMAFLAAVHALRLPNQACAPGRNPRPSLMMYSWIHAPARAHLPAAHNAQRRRQ
jgi:hypothetical protein